MSVDALRTPDERFSGLPDYPWEPRYLDDLPGYEGLRVHLLDLGPTDARHTFLCLHGEPTWSYLYRTMVPELLASGARVVAPDLLGFGRSDKPVDPNVYTFAFHRDLVLRLVERLGLRSVTLVVQDWGGTIGLTLPVDAGFAAVLERLVVMNTVLPVGEPLGPHFDAWRALVRRTPDPPVGAWVLESSPGLGAAEVAAYDAPFPDARHKAGVRRFPDLAMVEPRMPGVRESRAAVRFWARWSGPTFMAVGQQDPDVGAMTSVQAMIGGCPDPLRLSEAGHFVPEDAGRVVARAAMRSFGDALREPTRQLGPGVRPQEATNPA